jgi:hypothetical protein
MMVEATVVRDRVNVTIDRGKWKSLKMVAVEKERDLGAVLDDAVDLYLRSQRTRAASR